MGLGAGAVGVEIHTQDTLGHRADIVGLGIVLYIVVMGGTNLQLVVEETQSRPQLLSVPVVLGRRFL